MSSQQNRPWAIVVIIGIIGVAAAAYFFGVRTGDQAQRGSGDGNSPKLYWLIPDGFRADPDLFTLFDWAQEGKLPNIKKMMDQGAHGYSIPDFPSHTPTNFASLLTGAHPLVHGIADGPMHTEGSPLVRPSVGGFSSVAKKVAPVWKILEEADRSVALLSIPGSTPPELERGITIRGRWGGWGADTPAVIYEPMEMLESRKEAGKAFKLFFLGQRLTEFVETRSGTTADEMAGSFSPVRLAQLSAYGFTMDARILDGTDDSTTNYDRIELSAGTTKLTLQPGNWSEWQDVELTWRDQKFQSQVRARLIKLWPKTGAFRVRLFFNNANEFNTKPSSIAAEMTAAIGPMVDFVDNWPEQMIYEQEDKAVFFDEAMASLAWHRKAAGYILKKHSPDAFIQDTYTPNQMLESRWWHREIDESRPEYDRKRADAAWKDLLQLYRGVDAILGEAMASAPTNTIFVLSSDHGVIALKKQVRLNNLFATKGWLTFNVDERTGEPAIDWAKTKVIYMKMAHVYVNPEGLAGPYKRASGPAYEKLRRDVIAAIAEIQDEDGTKPLVRAANWQDAPKFFELPTDRVGDIVLETVPGYQWWEEVTLDRSIFTTALTSGYKQAVNARTTKGMWTPFVIMGPGVKSGVTLAEPISHVDQLPTLLRLLGVEIPEYVQGRVLEEILE